MRWQEGQGGRRRAEEGQGGRRRAEEGQGGRRKYIMIVEVGGPERTKSCIWTPHHAI